MESLADVQIMSEKGTRTTERDRGNRLLWPESAIDGQPAPRYRHAFRFCLRKSYDEITIEAKSGCFELCKAKFGLCRVLVVPIYGLTAAAPRHGWMGAPELHLAGFSWGVVHRTSVSSFDLAMYEVARGVASSEAGGVSGTFRPHLFVRTTFVLMNLY
jgi:hypothetical protein